MVTARNGSAICSSPIRAVVAGGTGYNNTIEYFSIVTAGNALDFGDITEGRRTVAGASNGHGGL